MPVIGLMKNGGRTPPRRDAVSHRSHTAMSWATLNTSVTMTGEPSATRTSRASRPASVAGSLGVTFGAMPRADAASRRIAAASASESGAPWIETKPSAPRVASYRGRKAVAILATSRSWTRSAAT